MTPLSAPVHLLMANSVNLFAPPLAGIAVGLLIPILLLAQRIARQASRIGRLEAKVDLLLNQAGLEYDPFRQVSDEIIGHLRAGNKIAAIKAYRAQSGVGLKEAKEYVEEIQRRAGLGS